MRAKCPGCGFEFEVRKREKGTGRYVDPSKPLGKREAVLLEILAKTCMTVYEGKEYQNWATVRSLQAYVFQHDLPRVGFRDWNYVVIQSALADLVGRGLVLAKPKPKSRELFYRWKVGLPLAFNEAVAKAFGG